MADMALPNPSKPIDARTHKPGPVKNATNHQWTSVSHAEFSGTGAK